MDRDPQSCSPWVIIDGILQFYLVLLIAEMANSIYVLVREPCDVGSRHMFSHKELNIEGLIVKERRRL